MVQINFAKKQVNAKIVYYGPGMSGKTTNLEVIHQRAPESNRGELTSISTEGDRTLFFDFMPLDLGTVAGMKTSFQIYTVPGQVYYNSTRKLVLQGVDGVIFVADSSPNMMEENLESLRNLDENLQEYGRGLDEMPMVIQYNKRDMPGALSIEELEEKLNKHGAPAFEAIANTGQGVFPTLKAVAASVLDSLHRQQGSGQAASAPTAPAAPAPVAAPPVATAQAPIPSAPDRPSVSMSQTGFHKAPSIPLEVAAKSVSAQMPPTPTADAPPAEPQPSSGLRMAQPSAPPEALPMGHNGHQASAMQRQSPGAAPTGQPAQAQGQTMVHVPAVQAPPQPAAVPAQATSAAPVMGVEAGTQTPQRRMPGTRSFAPTPSPEVHSTPVSRKKRSVVVTGFIVVASVSIGAALGGFVLSIL